MDKIKIDGLSSENEAQQKKEKIYLIIFIVFGVLIVAGIGFWYWWSCFKKSAAPLPTPTALSSSSPSSKSTETPDDYSRWKTYNNTIYGYSFQYSADAKIDADTPACIEITTQYGYVLIKAKAASADTICGRTGVGSQYMATNDSITVEEKEYSASGFYTESASSGLYEEFFMLSLDGGTGIEYGLNNWNKKYPEAPYETVKGEIKKIVESFNEE